VRRTAGKHPGLLRSVWLVLVLLLSYLSCWELNRFLALCLVHAHVQPSEAVLISSIACFALFPWLVLWLFSAPRGTRNCVRVASASLVMWTSTFFMEAGV